MVAPKTRTPRRSSLNTGTAAGGLGLRSFFLLASVLLSPPAVRCFGVDAIIVRPSAWKTAVQPWLQYRSVQGHEIVEIDAELDREEIQSAIFQTYAENREHLRFVLLAGDVSQHRELSIPTFYRQSTAMVQFGGDPSIATDSPYGDVNGDDIPELAVGRIPADSPAQLENLLARVMAYESQQDFSPWRRDVHVVAGVGGFGLVADSVIEMTTRRFLADRIPGWTQLSMTQASTSSHFCPDPWRFDEVTLGRLNQGSMFWVYIGHGHVQTLDFMRVKNEMLPILNNRHVPAISIEKHPPIALFFACYTGAFDATVDSLAEQMVLCRKGPIAAIAASRVSGPYGLAMLSNGLLENFYNVAQPTLGETVLAAKREMLLEPKVTPAEQKNASDQMQMISAIASALSPEDYDLRAERVEHVWQMQLLGDPMMQLNHPQLIDLDVPSRAAPGDTIAIKGICGEPGKVTIEFGFRRDQVRKELDDLTGDLDTQAGRDMQQRRYLAANAWSICKIETECSADSFAAELTIPKDLPRGRYCIRVFCEATRKWHVGYTEITIRQPGS